MSKNGLIDAGQYGSWEVYVESITHGFQIVHSETETRRFRTFYPKRLLSDNWAVAIVFSNHKALQEFATWCVTFFGEASNPYGDTPSPVTVSIPSRQFARQGYPVSAVPFGDQFGEVLYRVRLSFVSAASGFSESDSSRFLGPATDATAYSFYPAGLQPGDISRPGPGPLTGVSGDDGKVYGNGQGPVRRS
jgi:hypothetical protein